MSFEYYTNWWIVNKKHLEDVYIRDEIFRKKAKPIAERNLANMLIGGLYAKYSLLVQDIDGCLDQMAQPQKRMTVKKLLDAATIRLYELNDQLKKMDFSEFHYIDGSLIELKLIPYDVEILHPSMFFARPIDVEDMWQKIKKGEKIFVPPEPEVPKEEPNESETVVQPEEVVDDGKKAKEKKSKRPKKIMMGEEKPPLTAEELEEIRRKQLKTDSIKLIQTAERARQERMYFFIMDQIFKRNEAAKKLAQTQPQSQKTPQAEETTPPSPVKIQAAWRAYSDRENIKFKELERRMLIKMYEPSWRSRKEFETFEKNLDKRREYRDQRIREYIQSIDQEKARILRVVAPGLMEDIGDEIREWFRVWYKEAKCFDKYPSEEKGGTILVVRGETMTPLEYLDEYEKKRRAKVKAGGADKQKQKEKMEKLKKAEAEKKKKEAEKKRKEAEAKKKKKKKKPGDYEYEYADTAAKKIYDEGIDEHTRIWDERNDFENPLEKHYMDMITEEKCYEVQLEVRKDVDELMRLELELLEEALERDKIRLKGKKGKKKKKKKAKKKKRKGKKGKKDPTANRTTEDLFQELVDNEIIRTYPPARLDQYVGDFSYRNWELRNNNFDPPATLLDVRQAVVMNCIAPLGVQVMKRPKSVLIAGPRQSGKHLLANAIFNETKCVLFDLSPERTAGKYPGKKGMKMFIHLINKMSRLLSPSILYFDGAEKIFYKKVPKEEKELEPKRIGKKLMKGIIKPITPEDRVLVLGITGKPWAGQAGKMKKAFEKNILIPRPDYGSIYLYWRQLLMPYHGLDRNFNVTALTGVTVNYPYSVIREVLEKIMTPRRIIQFKYNPLTPNEVYEYFVANGIEPITDKEYKKFQKWYRKTPLGKEKAGFNKWADNQRAIEAKQKEKQNRKR